MTNIDFCTTAMARPELINKTYSSFSNNLKGINLKDCRLFINVDPLPGEIDRIKVVKVAQKYFKEVHYNFPSKANFSISLNWVWSNASAEYIFHLEDDWKLVREISMLDILRYFKKHPELQEVVLKAYKFKYRSCALSPGVFHRRFYKAVAGKLDETINPEIQLRGKKFGIEMPAPCFNIPWYGKVIAYPKKIVVKDIGRFWLKKSKFRKPKKKGNFINWEAKK